MGRLTRWGCDPRTGRRIAPVPLVRPIRDFATGTETAASVRPFSQGLGCEGRAPEGTSGAVAKRERTPRMPAKRTPRPDPVRKPRDEAAIPERVAAEPVSRPAAGRTAAAVPVAHGRMPPPARINLATAPSAMDARADAARERRIAAAQAAQVDDGRVWCATCRARVPPGFGQGCIARGCALKETA